MKKPNRKISTSKRDVSSKRLHLARETLRRLSPGELSGIAGGLTTRTCTCPPPDTGV